MSTAEYWEGQIDRARLIFPGLAGLYQSIAPYSYAIIRFFAGAVLVYHGYGKLFGGNIAAVADHVVKPLGLPMPIAWAYLIACLEFFGGAGLAIGFLTRPIALMLTIEFIVITRWHFHNGYSFANPGGGFEFPLLLLFIYAAIFFRGAGPCSVARLIGKEF